MVESIQYRARSNNHHRGVRSLPVIIKHLSKYAGMTVEKVFIKHGIVVCQRLGEARESSGWNFLQCSAREKREECEKLESLFPRHSYALYASCRMPPTLSTTRFSESLRIAFMVFAAHSCSRHTSLLRNYSLAVARQMITNGKCLSIHFSSRTTCSRLSSSSLHLLTRDGSWKLTKLLLSH